MPASNTVDIYFKGHDSNLTSAIRRVKSELQSLRNQRVEVKVDVDDRALHRLQDRMNGVRNTVTRVRAAVDTSELTEFRAQLAALRDRTVRVDVELNSAGALAGLAAFDSSRGNARIALDLDTRVAAAELAAFIAAVPRSVSINLDLDTAAAAARILALRAALAGLGSAGAGLGGAGGAAGGIAKVGGAASSALPALLALAPAVSTLASGAVGVGIFGTAAALGAVTAAAGAMSIGFGSAVAALPIMAAAASDKVKEHFKFMADDVVSTMKEISKPLQEPLVGLATALGAAFHQIRPNLERITTGVGDLVNELSGKMPAIAAEVGPALEKMFNGAVPHIRNLTNELPNIVRGIGDFAGKLGDPAIVQGAQRVFGMIPGIISGAGDSLVWVAEKFNSLMTYLDSGALDGFTSGISDFMSNLGSTDWSGVTQGLTDMANSFGNFMGSINTDNLATNLEGLTSGLTELTNASAGIVSAFSAADEALRGFMDRASQQTDDFFGDGILPKNWSDAINQALDDIGLIEWSGKPIEVPIDVVPAEGSANGIAETIAGALGAAASGGGLEVPVTPTLPDSLPPLPLIGEFQDPPPPPEPLPVALLGEFVEPPAPPELAPVPFGLQFDGQVPAIPPPPPLSIDVAPPPPVEVPVTAAPIPPPPPPPPVEIKTEVSLQDISMPDIPPLKVPVEYDTAGIGTLSIQPPPPVKVPVEFDVPAPDLSAFNVDLTAQGAAAGATFAAGLAGSAGAVAGAAASMAAAAQNVSVDLSAQGAAAGASFAAGIRSQAGAVAAAAAELGAIAAANKGHYKGRKGIAADRIMLIPHGQAMVKGFIGGMQSQKSDLVRAAQTLATDVYTAFDDDLVPNIGLSGGVGITQKVYVQVEAGVMADPVKIGREITNHLDAYSTAVGQASGTVISV